MTERERNVTTSAAKDRFAVGDVFAVGDDVRRFEGYWSGGYVYYSKPKAAYARDIHRRMRLECWRKWVRDSAPIERAIAASLAEKGASHEGP